MPRRSRVALQLVPLLIASTVLAQTPAPRQSVPGAPNGASQASQGKPAGTQRKSFRTPWGEPDLQGIWDATTATPFERASGLGNKEFFTADEVAAQQQAENAIVAKRESGADFEEAGRRSQAESPIAGNEYNSVWLSEGRPRTVGRRTSLVVDLPDGRIPLTAEAQQNQSRRSQIVSSRPPADFSNDSWLDRDTGERCITDGITGVFRSGGYNNNALIVQGPGYVAIVHEMFRDRRIIPTDGRPHVGSSIRHVLGDSVGHWEGQTLVVETTNFANKLSDGWAQVWRRPSETLRLVERFTRVDESTIDYRLRVEDPATFTRAWGTEQQLVQTHFAMYEFACHEGNYGMRHLLSEARGVEKAAKKGGTR